MNGKEYLIKILRFIIVFFLILMSCVTLISIITITNL